MPWIKHHEYASNVILLKSGGWCISYDPSPLWADSGGCETAIRLYENSFILNGDWRIEYEACEIWDEALKVFMYNKKRYISSWSDV